LGEAEGEQAGGAGDGAEARESTWDVHVCPSWNE